MTREPKNTARLTILLPPDVLEALQRSADQMGTTVSGLLRMIALDWLRERDNHV